MKGGPDLGVVLTIPKSSGAFQSVGVFSGKIGDSVVNDRRIAVFASETRLEVRLDGFCGFFWKFSSGGPASGRKKAVVLLNRQIVA